LLYTHTMPNNHYCSTYMMLYPHLMAKLAKPWNPNWNEVSLEVYKANPN